ncbi:hypothetical protein ZEAMMB73_Zm00001d007283 [Zea mays]|uniref:Uncharacterized protein n=1 Tax=Zea mays TaxID=4577 RepID=A0A1D6F566_MAIZE|nr:hypothetical protein ZEAMMB73_Zm00001d007283 [Zea mays]
MQTCMRCYCVGTVHCSVYLHGTLNVQ